jgi:hypothetical protein
MPSAPRRERKPLLAVVALLLILVGGAGAGTLVLRSGQKVAAIEVSQQVNAGQQLTAQDFTQVQVPKTGLSYVPWDQAGQVANFVAKTTIPAGTLLTPNMVTSSANSLAGKDRVGVALKAGTMPLSLEVGDQVELYALTRSDTCQTTPNSVVEPDAQVLAVSSTGAGSALLTVAVSSASAEQVLCASAAGSLGAVLLPAGSG